MSRANRREEDPSLQFGMTVSRGFAWFVVVIILAYEIVKEFAGTCAPCVFAARKPGNACPGAWSSTDGRWVPAPGFVV